MRSPSLVLGALLVILPALEARPAAAETPPPALVQVRRAYEAVDYAQTRELAASAIRRGGNDRATTAELYWLWGTAAAALDQPEEALSAFVHALATSPDRALDRGLSPKIRAPYLEARGKLGTSTEAPLEVTLQRRHDRVELALRDTLGVAASVELGTRAPGAGSFARQRLPAAPINRLATPRGTELAFYARALDRHGNVLLELGSAEEPRRLVLVRSERSAPSPQLPAANDRAATTYYVVAGTLATLGLAAGGVATAMYVKRENAASDWNGSACERPGATRAAQCQSVDDRRERAENLAIGFGAAGGALLIGGAISALLAPRKTAGEAPLAVSASMSELSLSWKTDI
jgi:hypothetical protein